LDSLVGNLEEIINALSVEDPLDEEEEVAEVHYGDEIEESEHVEN